MIGLDTNVLVRYLTQDDVQQAALSETLINKYSNKSQSLFINNIVICELVWVLARGYGYQKTQITSVIRQILSTSEFIFEKHDILWEALEEYEQKNLDFSDALISKLNQSYGCKDTFTFDKLASQSDGFNLLESASVV